MFSEGIFYPAGGGGGLGNLFRLFEGGVIHFSVTKKNTICSKNGFLWAPMVHCRYTASARK